MWAVSDTSSNAERGEPMAIQSDNNPEKNARAARMGSAQVEAVECSASLARIRLR